ncbi:MAG: MFS transporter [Anaerolineae bacterium]|nr:MFS transporter [Anaerolineae bacterium]
MLTQEIDFRYGRHSINMARKAQPINASSALAHDGDSHPHLNHPLANRNFRLLWMGENISVLGDQFYLIALPWLVFQMTNSSLAFGSVLLIAGIPRALLMLIGGVMTDRMSPRRVMLISNLLRLGIAGGLSLLVATQTIQLWMVFVIAFCFGIVDAFFYPAYRAMIPLIVDEAHLQSSNALMQGTSQLVLIAGSGIGGVIVARLGMAFSFVLDAFTFLFTSIALSLMRPATQAQLATSHVTTPKRRHIFAEIREVFAYIRQDRLLTILLGVVAAINLLFTGPLIVGSATLSRARFNDGSAAYGAMLSVFSIGILIGTLIAGLTHLKKPGLISLLLVATEGIFMIGIGLTTSLTLIYGMWLLIGFAAGFGSLNFVTLTQKRVSKAMIGRFMSLIALSEVGLAPISNAVAGAIADVDITALFIGAGVLLTTVALLAVSNEVIRSGEL